MHIAALEREKQADVDNDLFSKWAHAEYRGVQDGLVQQLTGALWQLQTYGKLLLFERRFDGF